MTELTEPFRNDFHGDDQHAVRKIKSVPVDTMETAIAHAIQSLTNADCDAEINQLKFNEDRSRLDELRGIELVACSLKVTLKPKQEPSEFGL